MDDSHANDSFYTDDNNSSYYNFDSFVDPSMIISEDMTSFGAPNELDIFESIPELPSEIPQLEGKSETLPSETISNPSAAIRGPGSLYDRLTCPSSPALSNNSPTLYPYGSPYLMGSPSTLMMSTGSDINSASGDPSWMHSTRPRRRRSSYASPTMMPQSLTHSPYSMMMTSSPSQLGLGFNAMNMPYANPMLAASHLYPHPFMMAPPMSPMNVTVKLPMAPLTPTNYMNSENNSSSMKIPLVLPCHLQQQQSMQGSQNTMAPNVSKLQTITSADLSSLASSRCSSIAPHSSISSRSIGSQHRPSWFSEMSATKDKFLTDTESIDFSNVTVLELKQILRKYGLNSTGKKNQLMERIKEISSFLKTEGKKRVKIEVSESEVNSVISSSSHSSQISAAV